MAKNRHARAQDISKRVSELVRARALRAVSRHDRDLSAVYKDIAAGIRRDLRASGFTVDQVRQIVERHFGRTQAKRVALVEQAIIDAAREARVLDRETFDAVFGKEGASEASAPFALPSGQMHPRLRLLVRASGGKSQSGA